MVLYYAVIYGIATAVTVTVSVSLTLISVASQTIGTIVASTKS